MFGCVAKKCQFGDVHWHLWTWIYDPCTCSHLFIKYLKRSHFQDDKIEYWIQLHLLMIQSMLYPWRYNHPLLIREFVGIHNVVTNFMRANNLPRLFCLSCGSGFPSHCLGLICLWVPESLVSKVRKWLYDVVRVCARSFVCMHARCF